MDDDDELLSIDDLVTGKAAVKLGDGVVATRAALIVEVLTERETSLRFVVTKDTPSHVAIGMLRSVLLRLEAEDLEAWNVGDEDG